VANSAKEEAKGIFPQVANPAATPIMFASAMPTLKNLPGNRLAKKEVLVDAEQSLSRTTTFSSLSPNSTKASP
jgi:hypothetical protein